ncbi:hypothetical protein FLX56_11120 [Synechococcus moorigangaii CMS01]|nr:hypothetical protein [Synechococcus moorigangaii CMS01]
MTKRQPPWMFFDERSQERKKVGELSAAYSEAEVKRMLVRLMCRHLTAEEVIAASRRKGEGAPPLFDISRSHSAKRLFRLEVGASTGTIYSAEKYYPA